ncbi:DUF805 domain-containing protein [Anianabacter salinae]|uniref:DUF805 domain-containing protein n=1 Tax=Anianabacter salinae TaxID=2851023 RepID=UPI00225E23E7|nr:DUF805 domain-containing protein [Anianabacter salinae]MBV0913028.1 DUF805 domain-containing protein [Anianabacter salinae]
MSFTNAVRTCFAKYFAFSGRARRSEYWWFVLFVFLGSAAAGILDGVLFGSADVAVGQLDDGTYGAAAGSSGPVSLLFGLGTLVPSISAGWRRMHDSGRSGLYLLYPLIVIIGLGTFASLIGALDPILSGEAVGGFAAVMLALGGLVFLISPLLVIWWLTRPTEPGPNAYGPNPVEVTP